METLLFIISAVCVINWTVKMAGAILGNGITTPMPILHMWDQGYCNTYVSFFALGYQAYFWATHFNIVGGF
jgi:hypothetical protein